MCRVTQVMNEFSKIPSVDYLLNNESIKPLIDQFGRQLVLDFTRSKLDTVRDSLRSGNDIPSEDELITDIYSTLEVFSQPFLRPVINATGVVLHTNMGRSPIGLDAMGAAEMVVTSYSNLEFNLETGKRGTRNTIAERLLQKVTGAEAGIVVNNNAAALLLILTALAKRKRVIISRTQLIEIGDGFKIPEVMQQSGAKLAEVGSTNRVNLDDYKKALAQPAALMMHAHRSNFKIVGFTHEPELSELVKLSHENDLIFLDDIGSGALVDTGKYGLAHEPTVQDSLAAGADIVCFSGDKLLGGPQAGIIVGKAAVINKLRKHPFARAVRADKLALSLLESCLMNYLIGDYEKSIPIWNMISKKEEELKITAEKWQRIVQTGIVEKGFSTVGGGSLPEERLPTYLLKFSVRNPDRFLAHLRKKKIPVIARIEDDKVCFDPRTVFESQEVIMLENIKSVLSEYKTL